MYPKVIHFPCYTMGRFISIYEFAEGASFRGGNSHERELEGLRVVRLGVEFLDVEFSTAGAERHGSNKAIDGASGEIH
jgi:hypothetical protein